MPEPLREGLFDKMAADGTLMGMLADGSDSIYYAQVDEKLEETELPIIIFDKSSGTPRWSFSGAPLKWSTWTIKVVGNRNVTDDIAARLCDVLDRADITVSAGEVFDIRQVTDVDQTETINGERYDHVGHIFRVASEGA